MKKTVMILKRKLKLFKPPKTKEGMKRILLMLVGVTILGCSGQEFEYKVIISKSNESFTGKPLKEDWCRFFYKTHKYGDWIEFKDNCHRYKVGDTIHGLTKNNK